MALEERLANFQAAHDELADAYGAHGLGMPPHAVSEAVYTNVFFNVLGGGFANDQFQPDVSLIEGVVPENVPYFEGVRAAIRQNPESPRPETIQLGRMYGRWLASATELGFYKANANNAISIGNDAITTKEGSAPLKVREGNVIEYGMGINGLLTHRENLQNGAYRLVHIGKSPLENAMLDGIADFYSVDESQLVLEDAGITSVTSDLLRNGGCSNETDAIIASYVQMADDLPVGIRNAYDLLRPGGMLALRGPKYDRTGTGYEQAAETAVRTFGSEAVMLNQDFDSVSPDGTKTAPSLTMIVQKPEN
ncbi:MAG TPA: hypothetical protein VLG11_03090 [Candidatus Saccharimonadales bacterium]|nr:hypothetical protein [Candidatus Saccharimonadales bacterium]